MGGRWLGRVNRAEPHDVLSVFRKGDVHSLSPVTRRNEHDGTGNVLTIVGLPSNFDCTAMEQPIIGMPCQAEGRWGGKCLYQWLLVEGGRRAKLLSECSDRQSGDAIRPDSLATAPPLRQQSHPEKGPVSSCRSGLQGERVSFDDYGSHLPVRMRETGPEHGLNFAEACPLRTGPLRGGDWCLAE